MSVATKNPFAILDAEDASRPSTPPAAAKASPQAPPVPTRGTAKSRGPASRGGKYYARGGAARGGARDSAQPQEDEPSTENQRKSEGGRGRGRGRGGPPRGGRRPFDRHSQTGKTDSDKKLHQGWGGDEGNTELKAEEAAAIDAAAEAVPESPAEGAEAAPAEDKPEGARPRREREPEEEDTTLTLDQYLAQQKEKDAVLPKIEATRQANEGADSNLWKDAVLVSKTEDEEAYFVGKTKSAPKTRTKKEEKVFIEIEGRFERPERGGRGRGRGGDRGRGVRGRGGPRGGARPNGGAAPSLDVDDQTAFPSLS